MKHLSHEQLWALAETGGSDAHLDVCVKCTAAFDDVMTARGALRAVSEAPPMPPMMAQRLEIKLNEAFEAQTATSRWSFFGPRFAMLVALIAVVVAGAWAAFRDEQTAIDSSVATGRGGGGSAQTTSEPTVPAPVVVPKLTATVASANKARNARAPLKSSQLLNEGSSLTTEKGGALWLRLPDGTRAGLTGASQMQLATLEAKRLTLALEHGSLALVVPHREDRVLTVRAGELEVEDLGTQFVVSREPHRVFVAVEEGSVEVRVPGQKRTVVAGRAVSYQAGQLEELAWLPPTGGSTKLKQAFETVGGVAVGSDEKVAETPPPPEVSDPAEEWSALPPQPLGAQAVVGEQPEAPKPSVEPMPRQPEPSSFSLSSVEKRVNSLENQIRSSFAQASSRQQRAKAIGRMADSGDCLQTIDMANEWLIYAHDPPQERPVRREVLFQKMRCLRRLGRLPEADQVRLELEALPR